MQEDNQQNRRPNGLIDNNGRMAVLNHDQVQRLDEVMGETVVVYGNGNFPDLEVRLRDLTALVRDQLLEQGEPDNDYQVFTEDRANVNRRNGNPPPPPPQPMVVSSIKLNGGAASYVLSMDAEPYNDVDLMFNVAMTAADDDGNGYRRHFDRVKSAVLKVLLHLLPEGVSRRRMTPCMIREAYVGKMVMVCNDYDRWSLISLGVWPGHQNVELKFVDRIRRPYEFSVDSFQITVDPLLRYHHSDGGVGPYPAVIGESVYGRFEDAMRHLEFRMIVTTNPEEIRGGGLLKYCSLLTRDYVSGLDHVALERAMCSKFFADFPEVPRQRVQMLNYISNHLQEPYVMDDMKSAYLTVLGLVIECHHPYAIPHERVMQTLKMIAELEWFLNEDENQIDGEPIQRQHHHPPPFFYQNPPPFPYHHQYHQPPFHLQNEPPFHLQYHQLPFHQFHPPHPFQPCFCCIPHVNIDVPNEMLWRRPPQNHQHRRPAP